MLARKILIAVVVALSLVGAWSGALAHPDGRDVGVEDCVPLVIGEFEVTGVFICP